MVRDMAGMGGDRVYRLRLERPLSPPFSPFVQRSLSARLRRPRSRSRTAAIRRVRSLGLQRYFALSSIFHPKRRAVLRLALAPIIEPRRGYVGVPEPVLDFRDIGIMGKSVRCRRRAQRMHTQAVGRCQSNGASSTRSATCPLASDDLRCKGAPLGQCGRASLLVHLAGDEMALLIEMVVDLGVN